MKKILDFVKQEAVLCIACLLAVLSAFLIPPDAAYASYIDFRTLGILFCLMTIMAGLQTIGVFRKLAESLLKRVSSLRQLVLILVMLCFFSSMLITNDVALITFVPFTFIVLGLSGEETARHRIPIVVMQTVAANLGSMFTPVGNPQNLYLYGTSGMGLGQFFLLMLPYTALSFVLILAWCLWYTRKESGKLTVAFSEEAAFSGKKRLVMYAVLFVLSLLTVARVLVSAPLLTALVLICVLIADRKVLLKVDYSLLLTFVGFFVFIGNMGRVSVFHDFLERIIAGHETITAAAASQIISNVPTALLLSGFTEQYSALMIGTNRGGLGTLIASMASLISFKLIGKEQGVKKGTYLLYFTAVNLVFLVLLMVLYFLIE